MGHRHHLSANYMPGFEDDYMPPAAPEVVAPEPKRYNPEMSNQISEGIQNMDLNGYNRNSAMSVASQQSNHYSTNTPASDPAAGLSPFPKLVNPPPNVPPSDDELETRLENAREPVLNSNDPEMQLAWAADVLIYCGVCADEAERTAAAKPQMARSATPRIEHQLKKDAMGIVSFLADQHHPRAEFLRGMWLEWGRFGEREDKKEAFRCYSRAADRGYARAEYRIGMLYESYNDPVKALRHYHRGVDAGDAASCYRLGMMTLRGQHGQQQDYAAGIDLIKRSAAAADENAAQGAYIYGMLLAGELPQIDVPETYLQRNEQLARENIEKAAYMKFAKAQSKMGSAYELGSLGCDFNPALSIHYNALASKQGEADADMALSKWFLVGSEGVFPKNEDLAYKYAERAAQNGLATAEFALGYFHEIGMCVPVNLDMALEWYNKAAKHGNQDAQGRIDGLAKKQVLSRKDHENVAISRIKSQHASMGGGPPDRLRQHHAPQLGRVDEGPGMQPPYGNGSNGSNGAQFPPRGSSTTPYPMTPAVGPGVRPPTVAPYPEDRPPLPSSYSTPHLGGGSPVANPYGQGVYRPASLANPEMRPSSAFQINPELRTNDPYGDPRPYSMGAMQGGPVPRPYTAQPYDVHARPGPNNRIPSGPPGMQNMRPPTAPPVPGKFPAQAPPAPSNYPNQAPNPRLNIGYAAPYEERRPRPDPTYTETQPRYQPLGGAQPNRAQPGRPQNNRPSPGPAPGPAARPPPDLRKPVPNLPSAKPQQSQPAKPQQSQPPMPNFAASKPPGQGPKTFEEMGVPSQKKNGDCSIM